MTQRIGFLIFENFQSMGISALSAFEYANQTLGRPHYEIRILSEMGGLVHSSNGMVLASESFKGIACDTVLICGTATPLESPPPSLLKLLRRESAKARRTASICTAAFLLAEAGVLDGKRATTHWYFAQEMRTRYPGIEVDADRIFVADGSIWTSAGMTAGIDLALALVEKDLGEEVARTVARKLVVYHRRSGGQSQHSVLLDLAPKSDRIQETLTFAKKNLHTPLSVEQLAEVAHLSPRQFSRTFRAETGRSPAKAVEQLRLEAARLLMEQSSHSLDFVARETGFLDRRRMREAFLRGFGQPPQAIRRNAHAGGARKDPG